MQQKTLIFIGAHPDDETFGMGAVLAKYAADGVKVYYICATQGEAGTVDAAFLKGFKNIADLRSAEMKAAAQVLGLSGVIYLGYRDSGMPGDPDNRNPGALINAPIEQVTERLVKIIRKLRPDVVITHDPSGGYQHPDHISVHKAALKAFYASGDPHKFPQDGPAFQPAKLYFGVRSYRVMKVMLKLMPLFGQDPHKFGRNKDIDLTRIVDTEYPIHAFVRLSKEAMEIRNKAAACHASQGGGRPPGRGFGIFGFTNRLFGITNRIFGYRDYFMRAYPTPEGKHRESDLFEGLN
jgi:N-acetyl-1-D-myo-inositol-2-amino-2-deoxy-alpha-D-glucopyranoside deacetylase